MSKEVFSPRTAAFQRDTVGGTGATSRCIQVSHFVYYADPDGWWWLVGGAAAGGGFGGAGTHVRDVDNGQRDYCHEATAALGMDGWMVAWPPKEQPRAR